VSNVPHKDKGRGILATSDARGRAWMARSKVGGKEVLEIGEGEGRKKRWREKGGEKGGSLEWNLLTRKKCQK